MKFSKVPFVYITSFFILGIVLFDNINNAVYGTSIGLIVALFLYLTLSQLKYLWFEKIKIALLFCAITAIGGILIAENRTSTKTIDKGTSILLSVDEINSTDKEWRKSICTVNSFLTSDSLIQHHEKIVLFFNSSQVRVGDVLLVNSNLEAIENKNNPGEFKVKSYWNNKDIYQIGFVGEDDFKLIKTIEQTWFQRWISIMQQTLTSQLKKVLDGENLGVGTALLLGDKQLLSNEVRSSFSNSGAMHVLAVSGLHVGIVLVILTYILSLFSRIISKTNAVIISIAIIWIYAGITGFSPSVLRASFMFSVLAIAQISGRDKNPMNVLFFSAFVLLLYQPLWIYDIGFQLSYLAMVGIFLIYQPISKLLYFKNKWLLKIWQGTAVGFAAQAFTVPLTLYYFHQFPNYFVLTNIGMMVFSGVILGIGLFFFAVNWSSILVFIVGNVLKFGLIAMIIFVQWIDQIPFSVATGFQIPEELLCLIYFLLIILIFQSSKPLRNGLVALFMLIYIQIHFQRYENLSASEMVIFNSDDFAMSIKHKNQIICFHTAKKERVHKVEHILNDYRMVKPGKLRFVYLKEGKTHIKIDGITYDLFTTKYGVEILSKNVKLYIRTNYSGNYFELKNSYDMAYLAKNKDRYNLADGAKIVPLN